MDSLTQIVLGAACGEAVAGRKMGIKAALFGAIGGTIPDLDVFFRGLYDPFDGMLAHRGFSHSFVFAALMTPILGTIFNRIYKRKYERRLWMPLWFISIVTHPLLDIFTNYGTQFFWPFPNRITFNTVFVIDPLYTVPFMICTIVAISMKRENPRRKKWNLAGIYWSSSYLLWGVIVKLWILGNVSNYDKQFSNADQLMVTPMPLTSFYWEIIAKKGDKITIGYKSLFHNFRKEDEEFYSGDGAELNQLNWHRKDRPAQIFRITNGFHLTNRRVGGIELSDFRFGTTSKFTAGQVNEPLIRYFIRTNSKSVEQIIPIRPAGRFDKINLPFYFQKVFGR